MNHIFDVMYRINGINRLIHVTTRDRWRAVSLVCEAYPQATRVHVVEPHSEAMAAYYDCRLAND